METPYDDGSMNTVIPRASRAMHTQTIPPLEIAKEAEAVRVRLLELEIVEPRDWDRAVAESGPNADIETILRKIQSNGNSKDLKTGKAGSTLTDYQIDHILAGKPEKLRFDHYLILDCLGEGGMGTVLRALNLNLNRLEALKTVLSSMGEGTQDSSHARERFEREARVLASLDHPCITRIYHAGRAGSTSFIAMEFVRGKSLKEKVDAANAKGNSVPVWIACQYMVQVADALQHAHEHNVIHRDVKPNNIMISDSGELKVLDLGIARLFRPAGAPVGGSTKLTQNASGLGTPEVMSPEQWADATNVTPVADIYSLGCTFFYTLTGRMPFASDTVQGLMFCHVNDPIPKVAELLPRTVPKKIDEILAKMLAKFPDGRFQTCNDLIRDLAQFTSKDAVERALEDQKKKPPSQMPWLLAGLTTVCIAAGAWFGPDLMQRIRERKQDPKQEKKDPGKSAEIKKSSSSTDPIVDPNLEIRKSIAQWAVEFQKSNAKIWPDAGKLGSLLESATSLEDAKKIAAAKTTEIRRASLEQVLRPIDEAAKGLEPDLASMTKSATETMQKSDVLMSDSKFADATRKLINRFWMHKSESLVAKTVRENPKAWPTQSDLATAIGKKEIEDERSFRNLRDFVRLETKKRIEDTPDAWLANFAKERAEVWPNIEELRQLAPSLEPTAGTIDPAKVRLFKQQVELLTSQMERPFSHFDRGKLQVGEWAVKHAVLPVLMQWSVEGREATEKDELGFDARMMSGDRAVEKVKVGQQTQLQIRCRKPGFITVCDWDEVSGELQVIGFFTLHTQGDWKTVHKNQNRTPSRDSLVVFWTAKSPTQEANLDGLAKLKPGSMAVERYESEDLKLLQSAFARPEAIERMLARMKDGKFAKSFSRGGDEVLFARKKLAIEVIE